MSKVPWGNLFIIDDHLQLCNIQSIKAELLQLKPHPFICMRNFINKKVGNRKT